MEKKAQYILLDRRFIEMNLRYGLDVVGEILPALLDWGLDGKETKFEDPELAEAYETGKTYIIRGN